VRSASPTGLPHTALSEQQRTAELTSRRSLKLDVEDGQLAIAPDEARPPGRRLLPRL
jgi:hypothetical protein